MPRPRSRRYDHISTLPASLPRRPVPRVIHRGHLPDRPLGPLALANELGELRDDLVEVADDAEVGELEDRRVRVLVDRDDRLRALHSHLVLDRAGHATGNVELRRHGLARLSDLSRVGIPAGVYDGPRRGDGA